MIVPYNEEQIWNLLVDKAKKKPGPQGFCQMYMDGEFVDQASNLVVAGGREWVAQRLFNELPVPNTFGDVREYKLGLFAVGSGGATCDADGVQLQGPDICDTSLIKAVSLGTTSYLSEPYAYDLSDPLLDPHDIYKNADAVKPIRTGGDIELVNVDYISSGCSYYTKVKCTCVVDGTEPASLPTGGVVQLSEAGLYFAELTTESPEWWDDTGGGDARMFAHITFYPKWKEKESEFRILWYIII